MGQTLTRTISQNTEVAQRFGDDTDLAQCQIYPIGDTADPNVDPCKK